MSHCPRRLSVLALLAGGALLAAAGCSTVGLSTDKIDYGTVAPSRQLDVPPDLSQLTRDERFAVPERGVATASATAAAAAAARTPTTATGAPNVVAPTVPNARIERDGNQRWLAVDVAPEQAFNVLREALPSMGLAIDREDPKTGVIETVWAENRAKLPQDIVRQTLGRLLNQLYSTGELDKYRVRVERTAGNTSEVFVSHRGMVEVYSTAAKDSTVWQPRPTDPELEAEMLQRLALRFAPKTPAATTLAAAPGTAPATLRPESSRLLPADAANPARVGIEEPFDRAWRRVGLALDRGGFTVEDRDRARGLYFVRYIDPEFEQKQREGQSWFGKLFGRDVKIEAQQFRVLVAAAGERTVVTVQDRDGKPDAGATAGKILAQINEQLR
jgi:outer membrane protein assembly factor BamC